RHIEINRYDENKSTRNNVDDQRNRPESYYILLGSLRDGDAALGIVGPTYTTTGQYDSEVPRARYFRGLTAKSPVNITNIRNTNTVLGNYSSSIEYVQT
ncbi:MAG TPA: hypothetical protein DCM40_02980, partial [Maribacter sp.]|nr:hypothetical protein [Maribacter sp.]